MSFICLGWYENATYAGLLTDTAFKKPQFCCKVSRLVSSSLLCFSQVFLEFFFHITNITEVILYLFQIAGSLDWLSDV